VAFGTNTLSDSGINLSVLGPSSALGGADNTASGPWSTTVGGAGNIASQANTFAAGRAAMATHPGSFVWASPNPAGSTQSANDNDVTFASSGGFRVLSLGVGVPAYQPGSIYFDTLDTHFRGGLNVSGSASSAGLTVDAAVALVPTPAVSTGIMWVDSGTSVPQFTPQGQPARPLGTANQVGAFSLAATVIQSNTTAPNYSLDNSFAMGPPALTGPSIGFRFVKGAVGHLGRGSFQAGEADLDAWDSPGTGSAALGHNGRATGRASLVGGGQDNTASGDWSTVWGGQDNTASGLYSAALGGQNNAASGNHSFVGGGLSNLASGEWSAVGGGVSNAASGSYSVVMGGLGNRATAAHATVLGGRTNAATGSASTVGGGYSNSASGAASFVGGGGHIGGQAPATGATAGNSASGDYSVVCGGTGNVASGAYATVAGGSGNVASGDDSLAIGVDADTSGRSNSFAFSDQNGLTESEVTQDETLFAGYEGGVHFVTSTTRGAGALGVSLLPGDSQWASISDRGLKENLRGMESVLERVERLGIYEYNYIGAETLSRGPMAQDWHALFPSSKNPLMIDTQDLDGVALAALQELSRLTGQLEAAHESTMSEARQLLAGL
jgi:hypothetical protein